MDIRRIKNRITSKLKIYITLRKKHIYIQGSHYRRLNKGRIKENKRIVFLTVYPQGWNSLKTVYESMKHIGEIEVILLAWIGHPYPGNTSEYWKSIDKDALVSSNEKIVDLKNIKPDIVIRQTPYNDEYPKCYSAKSISKVSKLCYIPYSYEPSPLKHLEIEYNNHFLPYLSAVFCDNSCTMEYCKNIISKSKYTADIKCYDYGFPRFDISDVENLRYRYECYLWLPRWSLDSENNDSSSFFLYFDKLMDYFSEHENIRLIIRPHPSMFNNFVKNKAITEEEVKKIKRRIAATANVILDEEADYIVSFNKSDALISDFSSLVVEYFLTGKPIMYCGDTGEYNRNVHRMIELSYKVSGWEDLKSNIEALTRKEDATVKERMKLVRQFRMSEEGKNATSRIVDTIINEI